jgi:CRP-like cAMP-binding protein
VSVAGLLGEVALFAELPPVDRDQLGRLMRPFHAPAGSVLFRAGDAGDRMYVLESGELRVTRPALHEPDLELGLLGPGVVFGELSLLGSGVRTATVTAVSDASGWVLDRPIFDALSADTRPASVLLIRRLGELALSRLNERYAAIAQSLGDANGGSSASGTRLEEVAVEPEEIRYLRGLLFFGRMTDEAIATVTAGLRRVYAHRGTLLFGAGDVPAVLHIVLRGAVETTVRGTGRAQRVRLAGPGRAIAHFLALGTEPSVVECRTREHAVLLEVPAERLHELLSSGDRAALSFAAAFSADVVRALEHAERPMARMIAATWVA